MYAHHPPAPAPPFDPVNNQYHPSPAQYGSYPNGYSQPNGYAGPSASVSGHYYPQQMTQQTYSHHPGMYQQPTLPRAGGHVAAPSPAFNDFGMPTYSTPAAPPPPSTFGGFPPRQTQQPQWSYMSEVGYNGPAAPEPAPPPPPALSGVEAIPSPMPRAAYQAPVFKTFAERKREREAEIRRQQEAAATPPSGPATPVYQDRGRKLPFANGSPSPLARSDTVHNGGRTPSPAALRMMGSPINGQGRPLPPPRSMNTTPQPSPKSYHSQPQQMPRSDSFPIPRSDSFPIPRSDSFPMPPSPQSMGYANLPQQMPMRSVSPAQAPRSVSPAPPPRSVSPVPPPRSASPAAPLRSVSPAPVPRSVSPAPPPRSVSPAPPPRSVSPALPPRSVSPGPQMSPVRSYNSGHTDGGRSPGPVPPSPRLPASAIPDAIARRGPPTMSPAAVQALVERSDTISSVKSLDRGGFGPKRVLPQPPVGVSAARSLDRGPSPVGRMGPMRRGPSPVQEENSDELASRMAGVSIGGVVPPRTSTSPVKHAPRSQSPEKRHTPSVVPGAPPKPPVFGVGPPPKLPSIVHTNMAPVKEPARPSPINIPGPVPPMIRVGANSPPTPTITVGTPPTPTIAVSPPAICVSPPGSPRPPSPGISFSGLPTIAVSSSDTADEDFGNGEISISVPSITAGRPQSPARFSPRSSAAPTRIQPNSAILCAGCHDPIIGRIVSAMQQRWHPQCFTCGVCGELLEHVSSYEHEGRPYCHLDYHDRFAHKCHHCATPIVDPRFVTLNDEVLGQRYYHELHFFCSECGDPFLDPSKSSAAGTEFGAQTADEDETSAFVIHKGHPYCEHCHLRLHKPKCRACKHPIPDVAISAMGAKYHKDCFVCANCSCPFANNLFFPREGKAFCTECFQTMAEM